MKKIVAVICDCNIVDDIIVVDAKDKGDALRQLHKKYDMTNPNIYIKVHDINEINHIYSSTSIIDFDNKIKELVEEYKEEIIFYDNGDYDSEEEYDYLYEKHLYESQYGKTFIENAKKYFNKEMTEQEFCEEMCIENINGGDLQENISVWKYKNLPRDYFEYYDDEE